MMCMCCETKFQLVNDEIVPIEGQRYTPTSQRTSAANAGLAGGATVLSRAERMQAARAHFWIVQEHLQE
jgi:hypothetical protein